RDLTTHEIGSRRRAEENAGPHVWDRELTDVLRSLRPILRPEGHAILLLGDGQFGRKRIGAAAQVQRLARDANFRFIASVSVLRRDWTHRKERNESLIVLGSP
ncbi:MAG: hypothetical protein KC416_18100, partial [Myxococcales bacterium]|nr:hypothetical protein [Myxococcales bacterium]